MAAFDEHRGCARDAAALSGRRDGGRAEVIRRYAKFTPNAPKRLAG